MRPANWTHDRSHFFKYVTRATAKTILRDCTLRWSVPTQFNDPFDIQFDLRVVFDRENAKQRTLDQLWQAHYGPTPMTLGSAFGALVANLRGAFPRLPREEFDAEFGEAIDETAARVDQLLPGFHTEIRQQMGDAKILCLSALRDSILMWSHYAEEHKGAVIKLRCVPERDSAWGAAKPVQYATDMPCLIDDEVFVAMISGQCSLDPHELMARLIYTKALDWSYEKEWRICAGNGRSRTEFEDYGFHPIELEAIYLGCRMPDEDRREITELAKQRFPHAAIFAARKAERTFELVFDAVP